LTTPVVIGDATLYRADASWLSPGPVDAVVTSPPYYQQREYGGPVSDWQKLMRAVLLRQEYADDAQILVNLGLIYRDGECFEYWDGLKQDMREAGWRLFGWYVWDKGFAAPAGDLNRLPTSHEWVFQFNRSPRKPNKWVRTQERKPSGTGMRQPDGTMNGITSPEKCGQPFKMPDSVIRMPPHQARGGIENDHPAIYPVDLAKHLVQTFTHDGQTVLDPFMGSGTTGVACLKLGRKFVGVEVHQPYFDIACRRIEQACAQPDMFVQPPARATQEPLF
jgi:DNA modification methylase